MVGNPCLCSYRPGMKKTSLGKSRGRGPRTKVAARKRRSAPAKKTSRKATGGKKMKAYASFDLYLADQPALHQRLIGALRGFVRRVAPELQESVKWGNGCWLQAEAPVAYVYAAPDYVQFGFFRGSSLADPQGLLRGDGQYVRHIKVRTLGDIEKGPFAALLLQAIR